jgi:hypothetical protein
MYIGAYSWWIIVCFIAVCRKLVSLLSSPLSHSDLTQSNFQNYRPDSTRQKIIRPNQYNASAGQTCALIISHISSRDLMATRLYALQHDGLETIRYWLFTYITLHLHWAIFVTLQNRRINRRFTTLRTGNQRIHMTGIYHSISRLLFPNRRNRETIQTYDVDSKQTKKLLAPTITGQYSWRTRSMLFKIWTLCSVAIHESEWLRRFLWRSSFVYWDFTYPPPPKSVATFTR